MSRPSVSASRPGPRGPANLNNQLDELNAQLLDSKLTIEGLEKERDFYFGKLRDIEVLCQEQESAEFSQKVLAVLYQTEVKMLNCNSLSSFNQVAIIHLRMDLLFQMMMIFNLLLMMMNIKGNFLLISEKYYIIKIYET